MRYPTFATLSTIGTLPVQPRSKMRHSEQNSEFHCLSGCMPIPPCYVGIHWGTPVSVRDVHDEDRIPKVFLVLHAGRRAGAWINAIVRPTHGARIVGNIRRYNPGNRLLDLSHKAQACSPALQADIVLIRSRGFNPPHVDGVISLTQGANANEPSVTRAPSAKLICSAGRKVPA